MNKELLNCERVWLNVTPATLRPDLADYGLLEPHALGVHEGRIHALVPMQDLKGPYPAHWRDMKGRLVTPGLIDCHTHLIFAGSRAEEFELRQKGVPYAEIARKGVAFSPLCGPPARPARICSMSWRCRGSSP